MMKGVTVYPAYRYDMELLVIQSYQIWWCVWESQGCCSSMAPGPGRQEAGQEFPAGLENTQGTHSLSLSRSWPLHLNPQGLRLRAHSSCWCLDQRTHMHSPLFFCACSLNCLSPSFSLSLTHPLHPRRNLVQSQSVLSLQWAPYSSREWPPSL